jgi:hypothetical protein
MQKEKPSFQVIPNCALMQTRTTLKADIAVDQIAASPAPIRKL